MHEVIDAMKQQISIEGMGCEHCVTAVREALESLDGVRVDQVEIGRAVVDIESGTDMKEIDEAIQGAGYEAVAHAEA